MKPLPLLVAALLLAGCATPPPAEQHPAPQKSTASVVALPQQRADPDYPFSQIGVIYDTVLEAMLPQCFSGSADAEKKHTKALHDFVLSTLPRDKFIEQMTGHSRTTLERARTDLEFRKTKEFQDAFAVAVNVAVPMARIMIAGRFDVYRRKFAYPDDLTRLLFARAKNAKEEEQISWITGEVTAEQFAKETADWKEKKQIQSGDRILSFATSDFYWELMAGRQGYLVVRDSQIVDVIVTLMN